MQGLRPSRKSGRPARQRGAALLLAMMIVMLVVTATAGMVWQQTRAVGIEAAERARSQAGWILSGALDWARLILLEDQRGNRGSEPHDSLDEPWATPLAETRLSTFLAADQDNNADSGPEAFISGAITDAQARFNLAGLLDDAGKPLPAQLAALDRLCNLVGAATETAARIAKALSAARAGSSLDGTSDPAGPPLRAARLADLAWAGVDAATLAQLEPYVVLLPMATPVNVNTAPREVLVAAIDGIDLGTAERLVQLRQRKAFARLEDVKSELPATVVLEAGRVGVTTSHFEVRGQLRLEDRVLEQRSLLLRRDGRVDVLRSERRSFSAGGG